MHQSCFEDDSKCVFPVKVETTNVLSEALEALLNTLKCNQVTKEETPAAGDVSPNQASLAVLHYDRKGKRWMEITDVVTRWKSGT